MQVSADGIVTPAARDQIVAEMVDELLARANDTGGWGYTSGKASRLEPSSSGLIALAADSRLTLPRHLAFFDRCRQANGLLNDQPAAPLNYSHNAMVALAMLEHPGFGSADRLEPLLAALIATSGLRTPPSPAIRQDNMLEGWPWIAETFSWVEPTSWCLLALKRAAGNAPPSAAHRVSEAEKLLVDRCCESGGWNYGNSNVLGSNLPPYVPVTAIALVALQDRRDLPEVVRSLSYLDRQGSSERSGMALSLALIAARIYDRPAADLEAAVLTQWQRTRFLDNAQTLAMAVCALSTRPDATRAFRV